MDVHVEMQPLRKCGLIMLDIIQKYSKNNNKNPSWQFSVSKERIFWLYWEFADKLEMTGDPVEVDAASPKMSSSL